jgi:hypothetical protein
LHDPLGKELIFIAERSVNRSLVVYTLVAQIQGDLVTSTHGGSEEHGILVDNLYADWLVLHDPLGKRLISIGFAERSVNRSLVVFTSTQMPFSLPTMVDFPQPARPFKMSR